ncbi:hypothetical protein BKA70DRAFT_1424491 [Coprinopsis sp. MPI-PUGE-AT-0042]|nr:hypothetical protein BKA70DRAFT_1424491 [Coprinopsis sp. MPI-PUGE-AT-0042]
MSSTAPPTETGGQPESLTEQIENVISKATGVSKALQDTVVESASKTNLFSPGVTRDTYVDLMALAKTTATDARVKGLRSVANSQSLYPLRQKGGMSSLAGHLDRGIYAHQCQFMTAAFSNYTQKVRDRTDTQMVQTFDYLLKDLKSGTGKFETKDGKTFESVASDLKKVVETIGEEGKAKLEKANKNAVAAQDALDKAQDKYDQSKAEYEAQLPGWLAEMGLDNNVPRWMMLALYVPFDFLNRLTGRHAATVLQIRTLINKIKREEAAVNAACKKLDDALADVDDKEEDANAILEYQSRIKALAADVGDLASKLNVFKNVFGIVEKDCVNFKTKYNDLIAGKAGVNKEDIIKDVLAEATLFEQMGEGLMKFEVTA